MDQHLIQTEHDPRWRHVLTRDASADGTFVYAVKTTGVFCRPSCASRHAKPENVQFFDTPAQAQAAGFRACQRCHPLGQSPGEAIAALVTEACRIIESDGAPQSLNALAARIGVSPGYFHRRFHAITGLTPRQWGAAFRAKQMRAGLSQPGESVTDTIYAAGFGSSGRFYAVADAMLGMTASAWKKGGAAAHIRFAVAQCSLGAILVAQSDRGICAITLGDDPETLVHDLQDRFPNARLTGADPDFDRRVAQVVAFVEAPQIGLELPLDLRGTAFQQRVWQALREVPPGRTATYLDIARRIGAPKSVRAVAQACGANPVAVAVPCHRIIRTDGAVSGYRWGVDRKRRLLAREAGA